MDLSKYDGEIRSLARGVLDARSRNDPCGIKLCEKLLSAAQASGDAALLGFAYYYYAEACFLFNRYEKFRANLLKGMKYQQAVSANDLMARSYNMLAIDAMNQGSTDLGLDYFLKALGMCELCCDNYQAGVIHMNIAQVYIRLRSYDTAIKHLRRSVQLIRKHPSQPLCLYNLVSAYCTQGECYLAMHKPDRAHDCMERVNKITDSGKLSPADNLRLIPVHCFEIKLSHYDKDYASRDRSLVNLVESLEKTEVVADSFDDVYDLGAFMLDIGRSDLALRMIQRVRPCIEASGILNLRFKLAAFCVQYYKQVRDRDGLFSASLEYYELSQAMENSRIQSYQYSVEIHTAMDELRRKQLSILEENVRLTHQAETDPLTALPNRYALNRHSEAAFERAYRNKTPLAVCIIDIDHFKEFNDTYGHQAGDTCLASIAAKLADIADGRTFCARYGGDEFVVIYEGMTDDEVNEKAEQLRSAVSSLQIPHSRNSVAPYVTISQGIRNSVPVEDNRLWDYLFAADNALYHIKGTQKGGILLIHKTKLADSTFNAE